MLARRSFLGFLLLVTASVFPAACAAIDSLGTGNGASSADGGAAASSADAAAEAGPSGVACGVEQTTSATMCRGLSSCPGLVVDPETFPKCGFKIGPTGASLVCACSGSLCGMGTFSTCTEAAALLKGTTEAEVCVQLGEGRCQEPSDPSAGGSSPSTCDRSCLSECGGGSGCAAMCGCA